MADFVTIDGRDLKQAMKLVISMIDKRMTIPILAYAKLEIDGSAFRIVATNLDEEIVTDIGMMDGSGKWSVCISASVLRSIARIAGASTIRIEPRNDGARITTQDGTATLNVHTLPVTDWPDLHWKERGDLIEAFSNGSLSALLEKVSWCISTEETRYYLNGVFWRINSEGRRLVATDGHRLAELRYSNESAPDMQMIVPRAAVRFLSQQLAGKDLRVFRLGSEGGHTAIEVVAPGIVYRTKLIDGTFPDYQRVIPQQDSIAYRFTDMNRVELASAIDAVTALDRTNKGVRFRPEEGKLCLEQQTVDFGTATVVTSAAWPVVGKEPAKAFGFNGRYLRDIVSRCSGNITLDMINSGAPFVIRDADPDLLRVIMPMRV